MHIVSTLFPLQHIPISIPQRCGISRAKVIPFYMQRYFFFPKGSVCILLALLGIFLEIGHWTVLLPQMYFITRNNYKSIHTSFWRILVLVREQESQVFHRDNADGIYYKAFWTIKRHQAKGKWNLSPFLHSHINISYHQLPTKI